MSVGSNFVSSKRKSMKLCKLKEVIALFLYGFVSISLVFLNKRIFLGTFSYPLFTTFTQQVCGLFSYIFVYKVNGLVLKEKRLFSRPTIEFKKIKTCIWMSGSCTIYILLSNLCLKYVPISSYAISRSSTLFFNVIFSIIILKQKITWQCMLGCLIVIIGFIIGSLDSSALNTYGIFAGILSSLFQSIYTIQIKNVTSKLDNDEFLVYWYNILITSVLSLIIIFLSSEYKAFAELYRLDIHDLFIILGPILSSGFLNFLLGIITYWCIKTTSPIAYNLTGYVKSCIQTIFGILFNHETFYLNTIIGLLMTIGGSMIYTFANLIARNNRNNSSGSNHKTYNIVNHTDEEIQSECRINTLTKNTSDINCDGNTRHCLVSYELNKINNCNDICGVK